VILIKERPQISSQKSLKLLRFAKILKSTIKSLNELIYFSLNSSKINCCLHIHCRDILYSSTNVLYVSILISPEGFEVLI